MVKNHLLFYFSLNCMNFKYRKPKLKMNLSYRYRKLKMDFKIVLPSAFLYRFNQLKYSQKIPPTIHRFYPDPQANHPEHPH